MRTQGVDVPSLIDIDRYPITEPGTPAFDNLIAQVQEDLAARGCGCLPGFLSDDGLQKIAAEARDLAPHAYGGPTEASPYFFNYQTDALAKYPENHPLRRKGERNLRQVAGDLIPEASALKSLHQSALMAEFLGALFGMPRLYPGADKYQALNISVMPPGGCQQWHFDRGNMTTTLMLQSPEGGGEFQYAPHVRSEENENYDEVARILDGDLTGCHSVSMEPGTLMLFRGHYSLHRVNRVTGNRDRLLGILSYNPEPGVVGALDSSILHYGERVAAT